MELSQVRNMLRINKHRLDDELELHAEVLDRVGQEVVKRNSRMIELKKRLEEVEAKVTADTHVVGALEARFGIKATPQQKQRRYSGYGFEHGSAAHQAHILC